MSHSDLETLGQTIASTLGDAIVAHGVAFGELNVTAKVTRLLDVVKFLRDDSSCRFVSFIDVTATDYPERANRFDVVYHFMSPYKNTRIRLSHPNLFGNNEQIKVIAQSGTFKTRLLQ